MSFQELAAMLFEEQAMTMSKAKLEAMQLKQMLLVGYYYYSIARMSAVVGTATRLNTLTAGSSKLVAVGDMATRLYMSIDWSSRYAAVGSMERAPKTVQTRYSAVVTSATVSLVVGVFQVQK
jgi:hypothetical protein